MSYALAQKEHLESALSKSRIRLMPLIMIMFSLSMLDRSNIGFVKTYIEADAGIGASAYALGAGLFFIGYAVFEVPSNLILHKVGARVWLSRIMVTWGLVTMSMMFIQGTASFYFLRFLLGVTEAGFSPGVILYLTYWFPAKYRSQAYGLYYLGVPLSLMLGGPLTGLILEMPHLAGLANWQWMFVIEGGATVLIGIFAFFWLVSKPDQAKWLTAEEKNAVRDAFKVDEAQEDKQTAPVSVWDTFRNLRVWQFAGIYFAIQVSVYGVLFYLPTRLAEILGVKVGFVVGMYTSIPWLCTLIMLPVITKYADKKRQWKGLSIVMLMLAVLGISGATQVSSLAGFLIPISIAICGFIIVQPLFWNLPTQFLSGRSAAAGTAFIGAVGAMGGFVAPILKTWAEGHWQNDHAGLFVLSLVGLVGVLLIVALRRRTE